MRKIILAVATMAAFGASAVAPSTASVRLGGSLSPGSQFGGGGGYRGTVGVGDISPNATSVGDLGPSVSRCQRVCVKTESHGKTAPPQCIQWRYLC